MQENTYKYKMLVCNEKKLNRIDAFIISIVCTYEKMKYVEMR